MKTARPDPKIPYSRLEKLLEILSATILLLGGLLIWQSYPSLPETIPVHFNFAGQVDAVGPKASLIKLYSIMAGLYLIISILSRYPRFFNYPTAITEENAPEKYRLGRMLVNAIKLESLALQSYIAWAVIATANKGSSSSALIPAIFIFTVLILFTVILFLIKLMKRSD